MDGDVRQCQECGEWFEGVTWDDICTDCAREHEPLYDDITREAMEADLKADQEDHRRREEEMC